MPKPRLRQEKTTELPYAVFGTYKDTPKYYPDRYFLLYPDGHGETLVPGGTRWVWQTRSMDKAEFHRKLPHWKLTELTPLETAKVLVENVGL